MSSSVHGDWRTDHSLCYSAGFHSDVGMEGVPVEQTHQGAEQQRWPDQQLWILDRNRQEEQKQVRDGTQRDQRVNGQPRAITGGDR